MKSNIQIATDLVELNYSYIADGASIDKNSEKWWIAKQSSLITANTMLDFINEHFMELFYWKEDQEKWSDIISIINTL